MLETARHSLRVGLYPKKLTVTLPVSAELKGKKY